MNTTTLNAATGPRTDAGKAIAARNATTHGLFARDVVLPALGEDPAAYDALLQELLNELPPRNLLERHYLEQIAAASWRLRRLHRWQAQVYEDATIDEDKRLDKLDKVLRHENTLTRQIDRAVRLLGRDLRDLFLDRARSEARHALGAPEGGDPRTEAALAPRLQREVRRRLHPAIREDLGDLRLDNDNDFPAPATAQNGQNEPAATARESENCQNEPPADLPPTSPRPQPTPVNLGHGGTQAPLAVMPAAEALRAGTEKGRGRGNPPAQGPADRILLGSHLPGGSTRRRFW